MRVLFLPSFYVTGEQPLCGTFFQEQALALRTAGVDVDVAFVEQRSLRELSLRSLRHSHFQESVSIESGIRTLRQRAWSPVIRTLPGSLVWSRWTSKLVERYIARFGRPNLIHAHNALWAGYTASLIGKSNNIPYVVTEHSTLFTMNLVTQRLRPYVEEAYRGAANIMAVGSGLATAICRFTGNKQPTVVPNLVHTDFFNLPPHRTLDLPFVFLAIGHLTDRKGFDVLIRAFAKAFSDTSSVTLEIGGDGPERARLDLLKSELGVADRVRLLGALTRQQVRERMWQAHCFVLPSMHETFGVVLIEALACGLPVISTRTAGPEDIVTTEVGLLVKPGDSEELAEALPRIMRQAHSRTQIREYAVRKYSAETVAARLKQIYTDVLSSKEAAVTLAKA